MKIAPNQELPAGLIASCLVLGVNRVMMKAVRENEEAAHRMLSTLWKLLEPILEPVAMSARPTWASVAAMFMQVYFRERGNWRRIEDGLSLVLSRAGMTPYEIEEIIAIYETAARVSLMQEQRNGQ